MLVRTCLRSSCGASVQGQCPISWLCMYLTDIPSSSATKSVDQQQFVAEGFTAVPQMRVSSSTRCNTTSCGCTHASYAKTRLKSSHISIPSLPSCTNSGCKSQKPSHVLQVTLTGNTKPLIVLNNLCNSLSLA